MKIDKVTVKILGNAEQLGKEAAHNVSDRINNIVSVNGKANILLATGTSQLQFLKFLQLQNINWNHITVFHLDEYIGLNDSHPASFRKYLNANILEIVKPGEVYFIDGNASDTEAEINKYTNLLKKNPIDVACIGIGENGHIAFNDPLVADFSDPDLVKVVELDITSRKQQVGEGWFKSVQDVPSSAITLTIPAVMQSKSIYCVVPGKHKAKAVYNALNSEISTFCPASILRTHPRSVIYLDEESASLIK